MRMRRMLRDFFHRARDRRLLRKLRREAAWKAEILAVRDQRIDLLTEELQAEQVKARILQKEVELLMLVHERDRNRWIAEAQNLKEPK